MSAFIVSDAHLNYLVSFAVQNKVTVYYPGTKIAPLAIAENPQNIFNILHRENVRSVNSRYQENTLVIPSIYQPTAHRLDPVQVLKACNYYDYQACENEDYYESVAAKIVDAIRGEAVRLLPGYESAVWEIEELKEVRP